MSEADHQENLDAKKHREKKLLPVIPYSNVEIRDITHLTKGQLRLVYEKDSPELQRDLGDQLEEITGNLQKVLYRRSLTMTEYVAVNSYIKKRLPSILEAFDIFSNLPDDFIKENAHQRIKKGEKNKLLELLENDKFEMKMNGSNFYTWEKTCSVLEVVLKSLKNNKA